MPISPENAARYPKDWRAISERIKARADRRCEFLCRDGRRCNAPDGELVFRDRRDPEQWRSVNGNDCGETDTEAYGVTVVLTVAHLNHEPSDCRDENLLAGCQLHHLRYDATHHQRNAAWTRRAKKCNGELFGGRL